MMIFSNRNFEMIKALWRVFFYSASSVLVHQMIYINSWYIAGFGTGEGRSSVPDLAAMGDISDDDVLH